MSSGRKIKFFGNRGKVGYVAESGGLLMGFNDVLGGLLAGGVGGIASGFLGITSGGILVRCWC
jgi:hypothetical protein